MRRTVVFLNDARRGVVLGRFPRSLATSAVEVNGMDMSSALFLIKRVVAYSNLEIFK
jgi:hypothetical protein